MMKKYNPDIHHRRSIRLKGYDYAQAGMYFVTICVQVGTLRATSLLGKITNGEMVLNELGKIAHDEWLRTAELRQNVELGEFVIMPDHVHGIICITENHDNNHGISDVAVVGTLRATSLPPPSPPSHNGTFHSGKNEYMSSISPKCGTLSSIIRSYKSAVSKNIHLLGENFAWQRNYYEHIIRNEQSYQTISHYIINNPLKWANDEFYMD